MFRSPLSLAGFTASVTDKKELLLARKKMLAELELSGTLTISVNGQELSRQDIISLFDELADGEKFTYHLAISQDKSLLSFLENALVMQEDWKANPIYATTAFIEFISLFYAVALNTLVHKCLMMEQAENNYHAIINRQQFLLMRDVAACFGYAHRFFLGRKVVLREFAARLGDTTSSGYQSIVDPVTGEQRLHYVAGDTVRPEDINSWCNAQQLSMLNGLPDDLFADLRYNLASDLNELCVICDRTNHALRTAYAALQVAVRIRCGDELQKIIRDNIEIIGRKQPLLEMGP